jgi:hypothetical protein
VGTFIEMTAFDVAFALVLCFGTFPFRTQVDRLMSYLETAVPRAEGHIGPLLVLHEYRTTKGPANYDRSQEILSRWRAAERLWATPGGSNDDWYGLPPRPISS